MFQPVLDVGGGVFDCGVFDSGLRTEECGAHFGDQLLFGVDFAAETDVFHSGAVQPRFVSGRMRGFMKQGAVVFLLILKLDAVGHSDPVQ